MRNVEKTLQEEGGLEALGYYYSIYVGVVHDRKDPEKRGRLMLKCPQLWDDQVHEYWALPKGMAAGKDKGDIWIPEVGDKVWIQFTGGDIRYPVWDYGHWDKAGALSEIYNDAGEPNKRLIQTNGGHRMLIDDENNLIEVKTKKGRTFLINDDGVSIISSGNDSISLGSKDKSAEPAVLGDKNADLHEAHLDVNMQHTHMTAMGASSVPLNLADYQITKLRIDPTKSTKVSLD